MPFVRDVAVTEFPAAVGAGTGDMPVHEAGDMLIVFGAKDTNAAMTETSGLYQSINAQGLSDTAWGGSWYYRAPTNASAPPTFTWSSETAVIIVVAVGNPHGSNVPTGVVSAADDNTIPYQNAASKTTPSDNTLALFGCYVDQIIAPTPWPRDLQALYAGDVVAGGCAVGWHFYPTSGTQTNTVRFFSGTADNVRILTVCVEDVGTNTVSGGYLDPTSSSPEILSALTGAAITFNGRAWSLPGTVTRTLYGRDFTAVYDSNGMRREASLNNTTTADVTLINTVGAAIYFGYQEKFRQMVLDISTAGTGSPAGVWEYWNGTGWATLTTITTGTAADLTFSSSTGRRVFRWSPPSAWNPYELFPSGFSGIPNSPGSDEQRAPDDPDYNLDVMDTGFSGYGSPGPLYYIRRRVTTGWTVAPIFSQGAVNGMGAVTDTIGSTADSGYNPYLSSHAQPGATTGVHVINGGEYLSNTAIDMDPGYLLGSFRWTIPRDIIDAGRVRDHKGASILLYDTSNNYRIWTIAGSDARDSRSDARLTYGIQPAQTQDTAWGHQNVSGSFNAALIDTVAPHVSSAVAAAACQFSGLFFVNGPAVLAGGTSDTPLGIADVTDALIRGSSLFPSVQVADKAATFYVPLQMGGGDPANFSLSLATIQFPTQASITDKTGAWHVDDGTVGIEFYGESGMLQHYLGCTFISGSPFYWRFNASHSAGADVDFTGSSVVNALVTLRSTVTLSTVTFQECGTFALNSAVLDECTFKDTKVSADVLADLEDITNSSFTSTGTGYAIEVGGTAAEIDLTNLTFSGYAGTDGTTGNEAIYVNTSAGTVTLNILGGSTPSVRAAAGVTVVKVVNPVTLSVHVQDINTSAAISGARVWAPITSSAGGWPYNASVTITSAGTTATVAHTGHGLSTNDWVWIQGATIDGYNGTFQITVTGNDAYTYTMTTDPASPATGTITSTFVFLSTTTNGSGDASSIYTLDADQTIGGRVRTAVGGGPYYKTAPISGTIDSATGLSLTIQMIPDS